MSVVNPTIDDLLAATDENRFLLCEMAARRARDINDMMRNQHSRAEQLADIEDISVFMSDEDGHAPNPLSIAFDEIAPKKDEEGNVVAKGDLSYDYRHLDAALGLEREYPEEPVEEVEVAEEPEAAEETEDEPELAVEDIVDALLAE